MMTGYGETLILLLIAVLVPLYIRWEFAQSAKDRKLRADRGAELRRFFEGEHPHGRVGDPSRTVSQRPIQVSGVAGWDGGVRRSGSAAVGVGPARTGGAAQTSGQRPSSGVTAVPTKSVEPWLAGSDVV